ncbi:MAG: heat-inducible transcriptional repressor HrcA [Candidatus Omnitrophica bacterium]|nr:heat-inducible transcriptional repressor HrcA [Candidatus Omnitrophota bacterium]
MNKLSQRKSDILHHIIDSYREIMQPVGSRVLTKKLGCHLSAATIRNEMYDLEELGYITHPHTSAGRIPTDKGYRYYVDNLLQDEVISENIARTLKKEFKKKLDDIDDLIEKTSHIVSAISHEACIAVLFRPRCFLLKQINLIPLEAHRILVVWMSSSGVVKHDIIDFKEHITQEYLQKISNFLNQELVGLPLEQIESYLLRKLSKERDSLYQVYQWAKPIIKTIFTQKKLSGNIYLEGKNHILEKPEFNDVSTIKRIFGILEDKKELLDLLDIHSCDTNIKIRIGKENRCHDLWDCALISTQYTLRNEYLGTINIIGSKRMCYGHLISLLQHISCLMTETVNKLEII